MVQPDKQKLYIVRRESGGIGGAEKVAHRFVKYFLKIFRNRAHPCWKDY